MIYLRNVATSCNDSRNLSNKIIEVMLWLHWINNFRPNIISSFFGMCLDFSDTFLFFVYRFQTEMYNLIQLEEPLNLAFTGEAENCYVITWILNLQI